MSLSRCTSSQRPFAALGDRLEGKISSGLSGSFVDVVEKGTKLLGKTRADSQRPGRAFPPTFAGMEPTIRLWGIYRHGLFTLVGAT